MRTFTLEPGRLQLAEDWMHEQLQMWERRLDQLDAHLVLLETNQGDMVVEFYPDKAVGHVRNFLDLAYTGFYDGVTFHRVMPGFMIQGGDPTGTGNGNGPRRLKAEFTDEPHQRGVLSMARTPNHPDSASCQFFICHGEAGFLDQKYTAFGRVSDGLDALDAIANAECEPPRSAQDEGSRPVQPVAIRKITLLGE